MGLFKREKENYITLKNGRKVTDIHFCTPNTFRKKAKEYGFISDKHNILLSKNVKISAENDNLKINNYRNIAIIGSCGYDRKYNERFKYVEENILVGEGNYVITFDGIEVSDGIYQKVKDNVSLKEKGYRLALFDPLVDTGLKYNPLLYASHSDEETVGYLCDEILNREGNEKLNPLVFNRKYDLFYAVMNYVVYWSENKTFKEVYKIFTDEEYRKSIFGEIFNKDEWEKRNKLIPIKWYFVSLERINEMENYTVDDCIKEICEALEPFLIDKINGEDELNLNDLNEGKLMLFIKNSAYCISREPQIISQIINMLMYQIAYIIQKYRRCYYENERLNELPFIKIIINKFDSITLPAYFYDSLQYFPGYAVSVSIIASTIDGIEKQSGEWYYTLMKSMYTYIFLHTTDDRTLQWESWTLGTRILRERRSYRYHAGISKCWTPPEVPLLTKEVLSKLDIDNCLIFFSGSYYGGIGIYKSHIETIIEDKSLVTDTDVYKTI